MADDPSLLDIATVELPVAVEAIVKADLGKLLVLVIKAVYSLEQEVAALRRTAIQSTPEGE